MSQITTHILDIARGKPAEGVTVILLIQNGDNWRQLSLHSTDSAGRVADILKADVVVEPGLYRLRFDTKTYYDQTGTQSFYPYVEVTFAVTGSEHYHVPLLISPFGYSTYRGT